MTISTVSNGSSMLMQSSKMMDEAARDIQNASLPLAPTLSQNVELKSTVTSPAIKQPDIDTLAAINNLNQASHYSRIGTNLIQRDQEMLGTMLDLRV